MHLSFRAQEKYQEVQQRENHHNPGGDTTLNAVYQQNDAVNDTEIDRLLSGFDTQLTTITGIDPTLAAVILSEIGGDIRRFSSSAKLAAYAGVDPTVKQSGDFSGTRMKMSKRGSPYLRRAIWLASTVAAFKDSAIHALYERKRAEGIDHMTVIGHKS